MIFDPSGEQSAVMSESHVPVEEAETSFAFNIPGNAARNPSELSEPDSGAEEYTKQLGLESQETDLTLQTEEHSSRPLKPGRKLLKFSRHGIPYPSLPAGVVKKLATTFARSSGHSKTRINKDCLSAIMQASEWFFEQAGDDLGTYAEHAGRKTIDETDIITLMKRYIIGKSIFGIKLFLTFTCRQRQLGANTTPFSLAQKYLPRELLQDVRMAPPAAIKPPKKQKLKTVVEENEARNETSP
jgi:histone H3/H4